MNEKQRLELANWVIKRARQQGAHEVSVTISKSRGVEVDFRDKELEKLQESTESSLSMSLYIDHRYSAHSTSDLRKTSLEKFIDSTVAMTRYLTKDAFRALPEMELYEGQQKIEIDVYDPDFDQISPEKRIKVAREIESIASAQGDKIISVTSGYYDGVYESTKVHSNGFEGHKKITSFTTGASVTVGDKDGKRPADWFYASALYREELLSPEEIGKKAAQRALAKIGMEKIKSQKSTMLVENRAAGRLFSALVQPLSGFALQQKLSYLEGMLNQKVTSEKLTIIDDPFIKRGFGSRLYDGEGIAARKMVVIENGILKNYYLDTYYAKKLKMTPTFASSSNIIFNYGNRSMEDMCKSVDSGILVTTFLGGNSNPTTGDFSFGIQGFLIENGALKQPVNEMNISGNMKDFWNKLIEIGNDPYPYSSVRIPALRFDNIQFSGI